MTRKRNINDWLLWLMVFRIYMNFYSWTSLGYCLLAAGFLYAVTDIIDDEDDGMEVEE